MAGRLADRQRLTVQRPYAERLNGGRIEIAARLASQLTLGLSARLQRDELSGRVMKTIAVQLAFKTVQ